MFNTSRLMHCPCDILYFYFQIETMPVHQTFVTNVGKQTEPCFKQFVYHGIEDYRMFESSNH